MPSPEARTARFARRPDVALVSPYPPPGRLHAGRSGVASYTRRLAGALTEEGLRVAVVAPDEPDSPRRCWDEGVEVICGFRRGRVQALTSALSCARSTGAQVIHLQHELFLYGGPATIPGLLPALAFPRDVPTVVTMHQVVDPASVTPAYTRMHRIEAPATVARVGLRVLQRSLPAAADAVIVHEESFTSIVGGARTIPHGIDVRAPVDADARRAARKRLGWPADRFTATCFGFLAPYKGLELPAEAARLAPDVEIVIAGGPHPRLLAAHDDYAESLEGEYGDVCRFPGFVEDGAVPDVFAATDVALFPYPRPHASSGALALALAAGTGVLMSSALLRTVGAGASLQMGSTPTDLADQLTRLAQRPDEVEGLRDAARQLARARSWPTVARRHRDLYAEVMNARRAARRRVRST